MLDTVKINHVQHISFTQSLLTDAVSVILRELLSYEHPSNLREVFGWKPYFCCSEIKRYKSVSKMAIIPHRDVRSVSIYRISSAKT